MQLELAKAKCLITSIGILFKMLAAERVVASRIEQLLAENNKLLRDHIMVLKDTNEKLRKLTVAMSSLQ
jgi:hypothetical protein